MQLRPADAVRLSPHNPPTYFILEAREYSLQKWHEVLDYWKRISSIDEIRRLKHELFRDRPNPESVLMTSQEYVEFRKGRFVDVTV